MQSIHPERGENIHPLKTEIFKMKNWLEVMIIDPSQCHEANGTEYHHRTKDDAKGNQRFNSYRSIKMKIDFVHSAYLISVSAAECNGNS